MSDDKKNSKPKGFEFSLDGKDFYYIDEIEIKEAEALEKAITAMCICIKELNRIKVISNSYDNEEIYFRINLKKVFSKNENSFKIALQLYNSLTPKQKEILSFLYKEINQHMIVQLQKISLDTLYSHRKAIYRKLGFKDHSDLVSWCNEYLIELLQAC